MKKAEAISILATSVRPREAKDRARYDEAVKMAIEALKCSETPKSSEQNAETAQADHTADIGKKAEKEDCISRQVVVKFFNDWISCLDENCHHQSVADMIIIKNDFKNLPSAQPERKKGEWIRISPANIYECSKCGKNVMTDDISEYDFCHGCGADMRGTEND